MALSVATVRERWDATGGQDPLFAGHRRPQLPASPGRRPGRALAALTRGLIRVASAVAAARRRRRGAARRVHARGRARSHGLQHAPRVRLAVAAADRVGVPAPASRREHEVFDAQQLRRRPVHRQERLAGRARSRHGLADEHEHDGRRARDDAEGASRRRGALAPRAAARPRGRRSARHRRVRGAGLRRAGARRGGRRPHRRAAGLRPAEPRGGSGRRARQQHDALRVSARRRVAARADGSGGAERAARRRAPRSRAATTCSCSARSSSATRCT